MKMGSREMMKAMQRMGIQQQEVEASEVIIRCPDKDIIIENPQVAKVNMMGQETWQVVGSAVEKARSAEAEIKDEDIQAVVDQTGVSKEKALEAIKASDGDLAQAIMALSQ
jgi:nascent polypeptide-associated complex subunit alpha